MKTFRVRHHDGEHDRVVEYIEPSVRICFDAAVDAYRMYLSCYSRPDPINDLDIVRHCVTFSGVQPRGEGGMMESLLDMEKDQVQRIMDDMWNCGIRPSEGAPTEGTLGEAHDHLGSLKEIIDVLLLKKAGVK